MKKIENTEACSLYTPLVAIVYKQVEIKFVEKVTHNLPRQGENFRLGIVYYPVRYEFQSLNQILQVMLEEYNIGSLETMHTQLPVAETMETKLAEQRLTLNHVSWNTYEKLLEAFGEHRAVRFHYDQGVLEFMVPLETHENPSDLVGLFICTIVVESGMNLKCMASTTLRREKLQKGAEPDKCYYIHNEPLVRGRTVDLEKDPPPDLVVEIDITHTDIDRNTLYASMGVPEFWRFNGSVLTIYKLVLCQA